MTRAVRILVGMALGIAGLAAVAWGMHEMFQIGSCGDTPQGGVVHPCPEGTGPRIGALIGGIFVTVAAGVVYPGATLAIPLWSVGFLTLGAAPLVAVLADERIEFDGGTRWTAYLLGALFGLMGVIPLPLKVFGRRRIARTAQLLKTGARAPATVVEVHDTGVTVNDDPRVRVVVEVRPHGGSPFRAEKTNVVSRVAIPRVGDEVTVLYDPADPSTFAIALAGEAQVAAAAAGRPAPPVLGAHGGELKALEMLASLRDRGILTEAEFQAQKAKLLGGDPA
jgi:hypothetical protein